MRRASNISGLLARLHVAASAVPRRVALMEVCGTHTMSAFRSGLYSLLPRNVVLVSGPGCPVCVTAQGDIDLVLEAAGMRDVTVCTYGDMLRVPGRGGSLEKARAAGADVRVIYSTLDAVSWAKKLPGREVVLAAVGFETTAPATAAAVLAAKAGDVRNFSVMASHKRVLPAMLALLHHEDTEDTKDKEEQGRGKESVREDRGDGGGEMGERAGTLKRELRTSRVDGFLCPGHVSVVVGSEVYRPIVERFGLPCVIAGFEEIHMVEAITRLVEMVRDGKAELVNDYVEAVSARGNVRALELIDEVFEVADARWRGMGVIPGSGLEMREKHRFFDARRRFGLEAGEEREIPGCLCGKVITAEATPQECKLFGKACTPINPIGPCMVSSEGTCQAYFRYARRAAGVNKIVKRGEIAERAIRGANI